MIMRKMTVLLLLIFVSSCTSQTTVNLDEPIASDELLYFETYGNKEASILVFFLPGDTGGRVDSRYFFRVAEYAARSDNRIMAVSALRPGTRDQFGNSSLGRSPRSDDNKTSRNINLVAKTIAHLKKKENIDHVIGVGHSGGALMLSVIIGLYPNLVDGVVLASGLCNVPRYRRERGRSLWPLSLSPHNYIQGIPNQFKIRHVVGENDNNTKPKFVDECLDLYEKKNLDARAIVVPKGTHSFRSISSTVLQQMQQLVSEFINN